MARQRCRDAGRPGHPQGLRPLLRGGDPKEIVARLKAEREAAYAEAPIKVMSDTGPHGEAINRIVKALNEWL